MQSKILDMSCNGHEMKTKDFKRHEAILNYLKTVFPDHKFVTEIDKEKYRYIIGSSEDLTFEQKKEVCEKLRLTSARFVTFDNYVIN